MCIYILIGEMRNQSSAQQTGSGKTFTITGGAERFVDRGLIPRAISYVFDQTEKVRKCECSFWYMSNSG